MRNRTLLWRPLVAKLFAEHGAAIAEAVKAAADKDLEACFALANGPAPSGGRGGTFSHAVVKHAKSQLACLMADPDAHQALIGQAAAAAELQPSDVKPAPEHWASLFSYGARSSGQIAGGARRPPPPPRSVVKNFQKELEPSATGPRHGQEGGRE